MWMVAFTRDHYLAAPVRSRRSLTEQSVHEVVNETFIHLQLKLKWAGV